MTELDVNSLSNALENESNASIMKLNIKKINVIKMIYYKITIGKNTLRLYHKKLKHYRYCSEIMIYNMVIILDGFPKI